MLIVFLRLSMRQCDTSQDAENFVNSCWYSMACCRCYMDGTEGVERVISQLWCKWQQGWVRVLAGWDEGWSEGFSRGVGGMLRAFHQKAVSRP